MTSVTDLCNRSLSSIGTRSTIASLSENSNEARYCNLLYTPTRDRLFRMARWNFVRQMVTGTLLKAAPGTPENPNPPANGLWNPATMPQIPWLYSYAYPANSVLIQRVIPQYQNTITPPLTTAPSTGPAQACVPYLATVASARFAVAQDTDSGGTPIKVVLTNAPQAVIVFNIVTDNPDLFDTIFQEGLVKGLAGQLAIPLTGDKTIAKEMYQLANAQVDIARAQDGNEGLTQIDVVPDWIQARAAGAWIYGNQAELGYFVEPYGGYFG